MQKLNTSWPSGVSPENASSALEGQCVLTNINILTELLGEYVRKTILFSK